MADCPITSEDEKKYLLEEFREKRHIKRRDQDGDRNRKDSPPHGSVRRLGAKKIDDHSSLFSATFRSGAVESAVMADQGADTNVMSTTVFDMVIEEVPKTKVVDLEPPRRYSAWTGDPVVCHKKITADVELRIRHGAKLVLRAVEWEVVKTVTGPGLLGRSALQAIGCDNTTMLSAACDKHDGVINVPSKNT